MLERRGAKYRFHLVASILKICRILISAIIHHALGRVLYTSAAAEVLTRVLRDEEDLQSDGSCLEPVPVLSFYLARRLAAEAAMGGECENDSESESESDSESKDSVGRSSLTSLAIV